MVQFSFQKVVKFTRNCFDCKFRLFLGRVLAAPPTVIVQDGEVKSNLSLFSK